MSKETPKTFTCEARVDIRAFATFARFLDRQGTGASSRSLVAAEAIIFAANALVANGLAEDFKSSAEAKDWLDRNKLLKEETKKTLRNLAEQIVLEHNTGVTNRVGTEENTVDVTREVLRELGIE